MNFQQNLFQQAAAASARQGPKPLLEFKAGKMTKEGKMVKPDVRKGLITITVQESILHFQWRERAATRPEDDLMLFPGEAVFKRVEKVKDGRVYVLEFTSGGRELFFWLQEPKTDKDDENCNKINEYIKNPPQNNAYQQQQQNFMNMFQGRQGGSQSNTTAIELDQLQRILQQLPHQQSSVQPNTSQQQPPQQQSSQQQQQPPQQQQQQVATQAPRGPDLTSILNPTFVIPALLKHPDVAKELTEHLPEADKNGDIQKVCDHVRSSQFRQSVEVFNKALVTGQLADALCPSLGLDPACANPYLGGGVEPFLNALNNEEKKDDTEEKKDDKMEED